MKIYLLVDGVDHALYADAFCQEIAQWIKAGQGNVTLVNSAETGERCHSEWDLGITFSTSKRAKLKGPFDFVYQIGSDLELDFLVAKEEDGELEEICYFGYEEGAPQLDEIAVYLGLSR